MRGWLLALILALAALPAYAEDPEPPERTTPAGWCSTGGCDVGAAIALHRWRCVLGPLEGRWCALDALAGESTMGGGVSVSLDKSEQPVGLRAGLGVTSEWEKPEAGYAVTVYVAVAIK